MPSWCCLHPQLCLASLVFIRDFPDRSIYPRRAVHSAITPHQSRKSLSFMQVTVHAYRPRLTKCLARHTQEDAPIDALRRSCTMLSTPLRTGPEAISRYWIGCITMSAMNSSIWCSLGVSLTRTDRLEITTIRPHRRREVALVI